MFSTPSAPKIPNPSVFPRHPRRFHFSFSHLIPRHSLHIPADGPCSRKSLNLSLIKVKKHTLNFSTRLSQMMKTKLMIAGRERGKRSLKSQRESDVRFNARRTKLHPELFFFHVRLPFPLFSRR